MGAIPRGYLEHYSRLNVLGIIRSFSTEFVFREKTIALRHSAILIEESKRKNVAAESLPGRCFAGFGKLPEGTCRF
ncbi:hypothetical protein KM043_004089 [Ampulex compressa]|nr:hypothetical protein KM043_004089 [Ampulex compressa]